MEHFDGVARDGSSQYRVGFIQQFLRLVEEGGALAVHRSMPSVRIAYIKGMRGSL
jgi:hypothetical protein